MCRDYYIRYNDDIDPDWLYSLKNNIKSYKSNIKSVRGSLRFNSKIKETIWIDNFVYDSNDFYTIDYLIGIFILKNGNYMYVQDQRSKNNDNYGDDEKHEILIYIRKNFKDVIDFLSVREYNLYTKMIKENDKNKLKQKIELFKNVHKELIEHYWSPYGKGFSDLNKKYIDGLNFNALI